MCVTVAYTEGIARLILGMANVSIAYVWVARSPACDYARHIVGQIEVANCMQPLAIPGCQHQIIILVNDFFA
jgi:hypothetical protein